MDQGRGRHGPISPAAEEALEIAHEEVAATNRNLKEEVVERALVTASGTVLHVVDQVEQPKDSPELIKTLEEIEKDHITRILGRTSWRVEGPSGVARILGLNPSTLRTRMGKLGIQKTTSMLYSLPRKFYFDRCLVKIW
jgi:transcriptional regulator with GAF, ATPase, and Fis domain